MWYWVLADATTRKDFSGMTILIVVELMLS